MRHVHDVLLGHEANGALDLWKRKTISIMSKNIELW